jgi:small subunit ribosomal protein S17
MRNMSTPDIKISAVPERVGRVVSDRMEKTLVVQVERRYRHPRLKKVITKSKKFYAHDEDGAGSEGDLVLIRQSRPLSKLKRWTLIKVVESKGAVTE